MITYVKIQYDNLLFKSAAFLLSRVVKDLILAKNSRETRFLHKLKGRRDGPIEGWTDGRMERQTNEWTNGQTLSWRYDRRIKKRFPFLPKITDALV